MSLQGITHMEPRFVQIRGHERHVVVRFPAKDPCSRPLPRNLLGTSCETRFRDEPDLGPIKIDLESRTGGVAFVIGHELLRVVRRVGPAAPRRLRCGPETVYGDIQIPRA
jgi:hypothetical protein